ncbi:dnaJ homolog subfamily C member 12 [Callorhinchus milii]|uniref:DnaJ-like subfamily C member 12 n=1 Tax=Callorhinchus milii TaxID=7868 RepID=V9LBK5_CALMI|nr:dnaJ homolog subfamily C member 12 [Callorhinchus milii]
MEEMLKSEPEDLEDYYTILGCDELSTAEQILAEFKTKALECHPDRHPENPKAVKQFQKLQEAKETLTDVKRRTRYDFWYRSRIAISFHQWEALSDAVKTSMHWAVRSKKEPMLEGPSADSEASTKRGEQMQPPEEEICEGSTHKMEPTNLDGAGTKEKRWEDDDPHSPSSLTSPSISDANYCHYHFRCSADAPSELLRKFRNYQI